MGLIKFVSYNFLALGLSLTLGDLIINLGATTQLVSGYFSIIKDLMLGSSVSQDFAITALEKLLAQYNASYIGIFSFINQYIGGMICPVLMGMFGLYFYKKKALADIKKIKEVAPSEYLSGEISMKGGTSVGLLSIPIIFNILTLIAYFVLLLVLL